MDVLVHSIKERNRITSKGMCVLLFDVSNGCSSSIKEINRIIRREIYVLLFDVFNGCSSVQLKK